MANNNNDRTTIVRKKDKALLAAIGVFIIAIAFIGVLGLIFIKPPKEITQGQADCEVVRVSGKLPGRIVKFYVSEGDYVHKGDTLVSIYSSTADAKLHQAKSMQNVASATNQKAENGTRSELKNSAYNLWQQAIAAENITQKTYQRMQNLFDQGVVTEQKRDEAKAAYDAAVAATKAAKSQYDMAVNGAQAEDKAASRSMVDAAHGSVMEVESLLEDQYLLAPCDGEVSEIYPHVGELVSIGAPVMSISVTDDIWVSFNVREEMLPTLPMGKEINVTIPAINADSVVKLKIFHVRDMGSYAVWNATKAYGQYDSKTFEIKARPLTRIEGLRPGMSVLLQEEEKSDKK
ncbi:MAG: efflux RND transporter periplasmic adaptor subunit [Bacteroidales bacterium]|nr:efflux RND transporter periplasmic adaptor subunit [Candidatus Sodaliphilus aphodohippi]